MITERKKLTLYLCDGCDVSCPYYAPLGGVMPQILDNHLCYNNGDQCSHMDEYSNYCEHDKAKRAYDKVTRKRKAE